MSIFLAIIGLSVLVFFHEFGHFLFAKIFRVKVEEFGLGYPPRLGGFVFYKSGFLGFWKKLKIKFFLGKNIPTQAEKNTIYSINLIPFGGFNKIKGELGDEDNDSDSFFSQPWWKKALIALGGVLMNFFLAFLIYIFCFLIGIPRDIGEVNGGKILRPVGIQIDMIMPDSPADIAGLKIGDIIVSLDGQRSQNIKEIQDYIKSNINKSLNIEIIRQKETLVKEVNIVAAEDIFNDLEELNKSSGVIGVSLSQTAIVAYPLFRSIGLGFQATISLIAQIFSGLWMILKSLVINQRVVGKMLGPIGIAAMTSEVAKIGIVYFLQFLGLISIAIGSFQIIPFPGLDGSRILFSFIEGIKRKPINRRTEMILINLGFYILLLILISITYKDIIQLF